MAKQFKEVIAEAKNREPGFFTMADVDAIESMELNDAKKYLVDKVKSKEGAKPENFKKAMNMISMANSIKKLMLATSNFILAQENPENKVIK